MGKEATATEKNFNLPCFSSKNILQNSDKIKKYSRIFGITNGVFSWNGQSRQHNENLKRKKTRQSSVFKTKTRERRIQEPKSTNPPRKNNRKIFSSIKRRRRTYLVNFHSAFYTSFFSELHASGGDVLTRRRMEFFAQRS